MTRVLRTVDPYRPAPRPWVWTQRNWRKVFVAVLIAVTVLAVVA